MVALVCFERTLFSMYETFIRRKIGVSKDHAILHQMVGWFQQSILLHIRFRGIKYSGRLG
jgi:hypothetical protein